MRVEDSALRLARLAANDQEQLIGATRQLLIDLGYEWRTHPPNACSELFARRLNLSRLYANLGAADPNGDIFCSAIPRRGRVNIADRAYFWRAKLARDLVIGEYQIGRVTGKATINFGYPILNDRGQLQAVVFAALDLNWLNELVTQAQLSPGTSLMVIDRNGMILAHYPDPGRFVGKSGQNEPVMKAISDRQGEGVAEIMGLDGTPRLIGFTRLRGPEAGDVYVSVGIPRDAAFAEVDRLFASILGGLGLIAALAFVTASLGGNLFIVRPVNALVSATKRLSAGDLSARTGLPAGSGELSQLARAFDDMAQSLEQRVDEHKLAEEEISRQLETLTALYAGAQKLSQSLDLERLADDVTRVYAQVFGARAAWLGRAEPDGSIRLLTQFPTESSYPRQVTARWDDSPEGQGPSGQAIRTGFPVVFNDIASAPGSLPRREAMLAEGFRSAMALPLISRDRPFGVLALYSDQPNFFTPKRIEFLQAYANQSAAALENARLYQETNRRLEQMQALRAVDVAITTSLDLRVTLNTSLEQVTTLLRVDAADVLLLNPHTQMLEYAVGRGFRSSAVARSRFRIGEGFAGHAARERRIVGIPSLAEGADGFARSSLLAHEGFQAYYGVPLISKGEVMGVLEIFHRAPRVLDAEWLSFVEALTGQAAIAIDNARLIDDLQRVNVDLTFAYDTTLEGWSRALDLRDKETEGHTQRVTELTIRLARVLGMSEEELVHIRRGALLHDIGKMGIPDNILLKPGPLTEEEWEIMRKHPVYAYELLVPIPYLRPALDIPYCHHEKWDGTGYPRGLKGEEIPLAARIFAVVDVWDALRAERPYRPAWSEERARQYIRERAGIDFEPKVVATFLEIATEPLHR